MWLLLNFLNKRLGRTHLQNLYNKALDVCGAAVEDVMLNISLLPERTADSGIKKL